MQNLDSLKKTWQEQIQSAQTLEEIKSISKDILGKHSPLIAALAGLNHLEAQERKVCGQPLNALKDFLLRAMDERKRDIEDLSWVDRIASETLDVTCPVGKKEALGHFHPISQFISEAVIWFESQGFSLRTGPDVETAFNNFDALNVGKDHPARAEHDTFYMKQGDHLLRTHTSCVQIRTMLQDPPPLRIIAMGRVYRSDSDRTHVPMFHQFEGMVIEPDIDLAHLKGCLTDFFSHVFQRPVQMRFRPSFFPFTTPSMEVDIAYTLKGDQLEIGQGDLWLEVGGCGMVHANVFKACNVDPETHQGFAFGMGIERLVMLKYGVADLRLFYHNDQRWLAQNSHWSVAFGL